jgi:hypothetical protein
VTSGSCSHGNGSSWRETETETRRNTERGGEREGGGWTARRTDPYFTEWAAEIERFCITGVAVLLLVLRAAEGGKRCASARESAPSHTRPAVNGDATESMSVYTHSVNRDRGARLPRCALGKGQAKLADAGQSYCNS